MSGAKLRAWRAAAAALLVAGLLPAAASAHALNVFAYVEGRTIQGEAYFRGRVPARNVEVRVLGPSGEELGRTTTDQEGKFVFEAQLRCDHKLLVDTGDGHGGEYTVAAAELPDDLPPPGRPAAAPSPQPAAAPSAAPQAPPGDARLAAKLDAVARQVVELRKQLDQYEQRTRLRDVLGGIGYIAGLAGLAYYFLGVRRRGSTSKPA